MFLLSLFFHGKNYGCPHKLYVSVSCVLTSSFCYSGVLHTLSQRIPPHPTSCETYLQVRHISVALLGTGVIRQLHIPETWELVDKEGILFDDCIEDILADKTRETVGYLVSTVRWSQPLSELTVLLPLTGRNANGCVSWTLQTLLCNSVSTEGAINRRGDV